MNFLTKLKGNKVKVISDNMRDEISWETAEVKWSFEFDKCEWGVTDFTIKIESVDVEYDLDSTDENNIQCGGVQRRIIKGDFCKLGERTSTTSIVPTKVYYKHNDSTCVVEF